MAKKKVGCITALIMLPFQIVGGVLKIFLAIVTMKPPGRRDARGRRIRGYKY